MNEFEVFGFQSCLYSGFSCVAFHFRVWIYTKNRDVWKSVVVLDIGTSSDANLQNLFCVSDLVKEFLLVTRNLSKEEEER